MQQWLSLDTAHKPDDVALRNGMKMILKSFGEISLDWVASTATAISIQVAF